MKTFVVERDLSGISMADLHGVSAMAIRQATYLRNQGDLIFYLGSTFFSDDGSCHCLFEARAAETVVQLNAAGRLPASRIRPVITMALPAAPEG